ncbi:MAG: hypothetical protein ACKO0Z_27110 [Betaproteobacteria bacterium]
MTNTLPDTQQAFTVNLRDLVVPLGYSDITNLRNRFETFKAKLAKNKELGNQVLYKPDTYIEYTTARLVNTYIMTVACATSFACYVDPVRGIWDGKYMAASAYHGTAYTLPDDDATPKDIEAYKEENELSDYDYKSMMAAPNGVVIYSM